MAVKSRRRLRLKWVGVAAAALGAWIYYTNLSQYLNNYASEIDEPQAIIVPSPKTITTTNGNAISLNVPFFVYETSLLNWENYTFLQPNDPDYPVFKHSDDLWLYRASLRHPQRTRDPSQAKLFFVPFLLNAVAERRTCVQMNATWNKCFDRPGAAYRFADKNLASSAYFRRSRGSDHVVVASHWLGPPHKLPNLKSCNLINFEGRMPLPFPNTSFIPSFYVGRPCVPLDKKWDIPKTHDFAMIGTLKPGNPDFASRDDICKWLAQGGYSVSKCGQGDQCPALAQAKYGFHPRGDTWGSNRVIDSLLSRTIPLFTDHRQYALLPQFVPWKELSYLVNVTTRSAFQDSMNEILARPASEYKKKRRLIEDYMHLFNHRQIYQFDAYLAEFAKRLSLQ